jgi:pimeloyl-ACP methyl ester carboxylesterase
MTAILQGERKGGCMKMRFIVLAGLMSFMALSCSGSTSTGTSPVLTKHYQVPTDFTIPPNPYFSATTTPAGYDNALFTRYYYSPEPARIKAILVLMPGFYGGAGDFDVMAKAIVRMGRGDVEVWTIDRRSAMLDDLTGLQEAWSKRDPSIAYDYYFNGAVIDGKTYGGPPSPSTVPYMSEWGLDMTMRDLNTIISLVPQQYRKTNVFLGGHSLGAWLTQDYAAYDFDGAPATLEDAGYNNVAGIVLLDGGGSGRIPTITEAEYLSGTSGSVELGGLSFSMPGVEGVRQTPAYVTPAGLIPGLGVLINPVFIFVQVEGLYAMLEPSMQSMLLQNNEFKLVAAALLGNTSFKATNEAMLGLTMDRNFNPISIMSSTLGSANGPLKSTTSVLISGTTVSQPTDTGTMVYTWNSNDHRTNIKDLEAALSDTYTTFAEWYFPMRLVMDVMAFGDSYGVHTAGWQWQEGLYVTHTSQMNAPVLAFGGGSGLEQTATAFDLYKSILPPARGCGIQPRSTCGFDLHMMPDYTHLDILLSDPALSSGNLDATIYDWIIGHATGDMTPPALP